ncbi:MAG TPA: hypothetical protein VEL74_12955 [Thermoanaerobaculia bacterium]|nr:hypothetical protein [Thermoanaerobaculia bacterium]
MPQARVQHFPDQDPPLFSFRERERRRSFRTPLFERADGDGAVRELTWGERVEIVERGDERSRVRTAAGDEGFAETRFLVETLHAGNRGMERGLPLLKAPQGDEKHCDLLWGDPVQVLERGEGRWKVRARGRNGFVGPDDLMEEGLLELYFIDVGQGDGVLVRTPDGRHLLIDGGYRRVSQSHGKSAADFVDWKFFHDYGLLHVELDAMIASHCDADHHGGLWDMISASPRDRQELDTEATEVRAFFHAGVSWWKREDGERYLGPEKGGHLVQLLGGFAGARAAVQDGADPRLQGQWGQLIERVVELVEPEGFRRLGVERGGARQFMPGYEDGDFTIEVLAPVTGTVDGAPSLPDLGSASQNTNGHSLLLGLRYGRAHLLLTGDLNKRSMHHLLEAYSGREEIFACDVAKGCHHGSDDVSLRFLEAMHAAATIISSGDNEGHAHPRPAIVAASALTGRREVDEEEDELITPLVYATEIERSVRLGRLERIQATSYPHGEESLEVQVYAVDPDRLQADFRNDARLKRAVKTRLFYGETTPGAFRATRADRSVRGAYVVSGIVYGLVNVRTDGRRILCATRNEGKDAWTIRTFEARSGA